MVKISKPKITFPQTEQRKTRYEAFYTRENGTKIVIASDSIYEKIMDKVRKKMQGWQLTATKDIPVFITEIKWVELAQVITVCNLEIENQ